MIQRIRIVLSVPLLALGLLAALFGSLTGRMAWLCRQLNHGTRDHVWWPIEQARRIVLGIPRWRVEDLLDARIQPRTDADRAIADADERLTKVMCSCGQPECQIPPEGIYAATIALVRFRK